MQMAPQGRLLAMADQTHSSDLLVARPLQRYSARDHGAHWMSRTKVEAWAPSRKGCQVLLTGAAAASMTSHRIVEASKLVEAARHCNDV